MAHWWVGVTAILRLKLFSQWFTRDRCYCHFEVKTFLNTEVPIARLYCTIETWLLPFNTSDCVICQERKWYTMSLLYRHIYNPSVYNLTATLAAYTSFIFAHFVLLSLNSNKTIWRAWIHLFWLINETTCHILY